MILWTMYAFFRVTTGLSAEKLVAPDPYLERAGFTLHRRAESEWGLLHSDWWMRHPPISPPTPKSLPSRLLQRSVDLSILQVLWPRGEATVAQVATELSTRRKLAHTTVASMLRKMEVRELVTHRVEGRSFLYRALADLLRHAQPHRPGRGLGSHHVPSPRRGRQRETTSLRREGRVCSALAPRATGRWMAIRSLCKAAHAPRGAGNELVFHSVYTRRR